MTVTAQPHSEYITITAYGGTITAFRTLRAEGPVDRYDVGGYRGLTAMYAVEALHNNYGIGSSNATRLINMCDATLNLLHATGNDDIDLGLKALQKLRAFADEFGPDPYNDEPDMWVGSGADHAEQLYNILETVGLKP